MIVLGCTDIHKTYGDRHLLAGVTLLLAENERVGLLGPNGCGKSTLLRILAGVEPPDRGERTQRRDLRVGYLPQDPELDPALSVRAAVLAGLAGRQGILDQLDALHHELAEPGLHKERTVSLLARQARLEDQLSHLGGHDVDHRAEAILHAVGLFDLDVECGRLSGGERRRTALARLLLAQPELLLLDEPTNHLDAEVTDWLEDFLLQSRVTLLMVTHDRYFLDRVVTRIVEMDRGAMHDYDGGYSDFLVARAARMQVEQDAESTRQNLLRRETEWMRRGPPARTTKAQARIKRYDALVAGALEAPAGAPEFAIPPGPRLGDRVLTLTGVRKAYGDRTVLLPLDLTIEPGSRLGIVGPNGAGKTTFLELCMGRKEPDAGTVARGATVRFASIDQARSDLDPSHTVLEEVAGRNDYVKVGDRMLRIESFLEQFLFAGSMKQNRIGDLSGGERNRVLLAKLLCAGGNVIVLDEPTNDLDLMSLRVLEEALLQFPGTVLVVSHDRFFLDRVATRILHLDGSGKARVHEGDLSALLQKLRDERAAAARPRSSARAAAPDKPRVRRLTIPEKNELLALPGRIEAAEAELLRLDQELADPALYSKPGDRAQKLGQARAAAAAVVDSLMARWEELERIQEAAG